jgi:hypothetical protein
MRKLLLVVAAVSLLPMPRAAADPYAAYFLARGHLVEVYQAEGAPAEVRLFAGSGEVVLDSSGEPLENGGCVEIFKDNVLDSACGAMAVTTDPLLGSSVVQATLDSVAYDYDPQTVTFTERGPSTITVDLTLTGTGLPRQGHSEATGVGFCGLPPDTSGGFVLAEILIDRDASAGGTLRSATIGSVDPSTLVAKLREGSYASAGACL